MDVSSPFTDLLSLAGSAVLGVTGVAITRVTGLVRDWYHKQTVLQAASTAAGQVMVKLAAGKLALTDVTTQHPAVYNEASDALVRVADAAKAIGGLTPQGMAAMVVGAIGRAIAADPTTPTVAVPPAPPGRVVAPPPSPTPIPVKLP
jgi:hypothetical protein